MKKFAVAIAAICAALSASAAGLEEQLAIQTWTLRSLNFDQVIEFAKKHEIKELQLIPDHIDYKKLTQAQLAERKAKLEANGLHAYTFGVAGTSLDKEENRKLFEFAKYMGFKLLIVEPGDFRIWDNLEELAKEYDIKVAVHNHGIKSLYGNPAVVKQVILHRDAHLGVCMDIGWITSTGMDAQKVYKDYQGRVYDLHLKDKRIEKTQGDDVYFDTQIGEGRANLKGLFETLKAEHYTGKLAIETDSPEFAKDPNEFVTKAKLFVTENGK
ncbi:MAG TPA: sugar phosphate isomerase/epimerase [Candidatus Limnocylindria bacterium]|jgi:sugar phosphate isomerase/epimerase|nr:sugar phosphate isomerase/epimerase [Candidatus Limnocylindria bacterium]